MIELGFQIDRDSRLPAYRQLARYVRSLVESGTLRAGERLPATRDLATALGLSRSTVTLAYELLASEELAHAHVGRGTFVSRPPGFAPGGRPPASSSPPWEELSSGRLERLPRDLPSRSSERALESPVADFRGGRVDVAALPGGELRRLFGRALDRLPELGNRIGAGWAPLRREIASRLIARGVGAEADEVVVTSGAQQGFDVIARVLVAPGDRVAFEQPGFEISALPFLLAGAEPVPIPVDEHGLDTAALRRAHAEAPIRLLMTTPATQCPTGVSLSASRRQGLLELAKAGRMVIVEDDWDGELRGAGPLVPALKTDDREGWVVYAGTFSKTMFPALRTGYVVAERGLAERLRLARAVSDLGPPIVQQVALGEWLATGGYERMLRSRRREYAARLTLLAEELEALEAGVEHRAPAGGSALWVRLPEGVEAPAVLAEARRRGVLATDGADFHWLDPEARSAGRFLYLNVAASTPEQIRAGVAVLGECLCASASQQVALGSDSKRREAAGGDR